MKVYGGHIGSQAYGNEHRSKPSVPASHGSNSFLGVKRQRSIHDAASLKTISTEKKQEWVALSCRII
ncbi:MAG: hypothetical protein MI749_02255 [Desulfovibrionales bacterium]|nr:hypothetical protein [Desulfovibrionales bacterium]